ncbi:MerR family transcriptional regulator [Brevundimonas diminuta]|jgi:DNA-binding transcriptional MerR regulator|uniref:MerR family transcriptional regulator n=1 Tax=Brevundimonas TaxID=41275 RepID=UPI0019037C9C|nr:MULTISPECIES: MerR family transcriptional regulator [Brevundimonas]MBK1970285.1 MerR family transcriptional regulator [Brevundimonas diminuta]MBK1975872.1 MerR family transcriptional regulator [Brevundimonas diminuta]MDA0744415.1 MerR family transcriptional regulator [Pseudomonadota bacterium]MDA1322220.1 MerR family transcriptional regulator [Pseudomonadota bacterium]
MKAYTVNAVARMAGVSVRALHHYDAIGLLKPAFIGANGYRYYSEDELLRLQQILIHRELGIPLAEVGAILDASGFDRLEALRKQRGRLQEQAARYAEMVRTIDRTISRLKGERAMKDANLYAGFVSPEKQAEYEAWLTDKYGPETEAMIAHSRKRAKDMTRDEREAHMRELAAIEEGLADALRRGAPPQAPSLDALIRRHHAWVASSWGRTLSPGMYAALADNYEHPDFKLRYEAVEPGFADYICTAMRSWAEREHILARRDYRARRQPHPGHG